MHAQVHVIAFEICISCWVHTDSRATNGILESTTIRNEPEQEWHLVGAHRADFCRREWRNGNCHWTRPQDEEGKWVLSVLVG